MELVDMNSLGLLFYPKSVRTVAAVLANSASPTHRKEGSFIYDKALKRRKKPGVSLQVL